ncbi:uncharacterized protein LOC6573031 [Drosophila mojavensis]|uniref:Ionotropic glutamate receptor C-terminal domain-containing protein n=1 Tax=Drosophila mojavensis TaxID=7230 RepID=B4KAA0_DROMO|nr:uncharacterized protein LOC6573031 [Drosophila mojavensis]EDW14587.1 uncharacterized protein Dmoj_GI24338 [Drosophila mojavensis]
MSTPQLRISNAGSTYVAQLLLLSLLLLQLTIRRVDSHGFGLNLMQVPSEDKSQVACVSALLRKYFHSGDALSGAVLCVSVNPSTPDILDPLMLALNHHQSYTWTIQVTSPQEMQESMSGLQLLHEKPQCYFIIVTSLDDEDLEETIGHWRRRFNWNPLAQFIVYLASIEETDEEMTDLMVEILLTFMSNKLYNVNVLGQSEENSFFYSKTVFPYHPDNNCGNRVIVVDLLDACGYEDDEDSEDYEDDEEETGYDEDNADEDKAVTESSPEAEDDEFVAETNADYETGDEATREALALENSAEINSLNESSNATARAQLEASIEEYTRALFEDKFPSDLSGCPIRAAYRGPWEPYIFVSAETTAPEVDYYGAETAADESEQAYEESIDDYNLDNDSPESHAAEETGDFSNLNGIEFQLVQTIAQRLHMIVDFKKKSSNVFHLFNLLIEGRVEMIIGGIGEDPSTSQFVSSSTSYHQDDLTWCVARAKRKHSLFNFLASFDASAWFLILFFIIISSLVALLTEHLSVFQHSEQSNYVSICLRMLGILLTQSINVNSRPLSVALRLVFLMGFFLAFFFSNTYQSFLISTLTTPTTESQISEMVEIYNQRMTIMVSSENMRHLNKEGEIFRYIREKFEICYNLVECLNHATENEHLVVVVSRQHALYNPHIERNKLYCFDRRESLYVYPVTMLLPKKFHLLPHINAVIQHVIESGHMQKWARDLDMVRMIQEKIARVQEDAFKPLTLDAFQGAFAFAAILLLLASFMLALEWLIYWLVVRWRTRLRPIRFLHRRLGKR